MAEQRLSLLSIFIRRALAKPLSEIEDRLTEKMFRSLEAFRPDKDTESRITQQVLERTSHSADSVVNLVTLMGKPFWEITHEMQWLLSVGVNFNEAKLIRYVPIRVYLKKSEDEKGVEIEAARAIAEIVADWLQESFIPSTDFLIERGSAWKRFWVKTREKLTQRQTEEKVAAALDLKLLDKPQAETTKLLAEGTSAILKELGPIDNACIQVGNALIVKRTIDGRSDVSVRTLTPIQLKRLEEDHTILFDPQKTLALLGTQS